MLAVINLVEAQELSSFLSGGAETSSQESEDLGLLTMSEKQPHVDLF